VKESLRLRLDSKLYLTKDDDRRVSCPKASAQPISYPSVFNLLRREDTCLRFRRERRRQRNKKRTTNLK